MQQQQSAGEEPKEEKRKEPRQVVVATQESSSSLDDKKIKAKTKEELHAEASLLKKAKDNNGKYEEAKQQLSPNTILSKPTNELKQFGKVSSYEGIIIQNMKLNSLTGPIQTLDEPFLFVDVVDVPIKELEDEENSDESDDDDPVMRVPLDPTKAYRSRRGMQEFPGQYRWCNVKIPHKKKEGAASTTVPYLRVGAYDMGDGTSFERWVGSGYCSLEDVHDVAGTNIQLDLYIDDDTTTGNFECRVQLADSDVFSEF